MNRLVLIVLASASTLSAGIPSAKSPISEKSPLSPKSPIPSKVPIEAKNPIWNWFVGGSGGYLVDNEEAMWHVHFGIDLPWKVAGFDTAIFVEGGLAKFDGRYGAANANLNTDLNLIPITLNGKLERNLFGPVNVYAGGGLGVAVLDLDYGGAAAGSDDEVVLYAQLFAGLVLNLTPNLEVFAGARWIYFDEPQFDLAGTSVNLSDLGLSNDDVLLEAGGRVNF